MQINSLLQNLTEAEFETLCSHAFTREVGQDQLLFEEGDEADEFYFVKSGSVALYIRNYHRSEQLTTIEKGNCFGEMGILNNAQRTASARTIEDSTLLCLDRETFRGVLRAHPEISGKLRVLIDTRSAEMALKESILSNSAIQEQQLQLSIKGDPSLRETVFDRSRYESLVDKVLPQLVSAIETLLLERNVFRVVVNFNSGEIETYTLFNPFTPEIHAANRLVADSYLQRHFPEMRYEDKADLISQIFATVSEYPAIARLSSQWQSMFVSSHKNWQPVAAETIRQTLTQLETLRSLENYYLRNFSICSVNDVIRMQFNCDGTHIVSSEAYQRFMQDNI